MKSFKVYLWLVALFVLCQALDATTTTTTEVLDQETTEILDNTVAENEGETTADIETTTSVNQLPPKILVTHSRSKEHNKHGFSASNGKRDRHDQPHEHGHKHGNSGTNPDEFGY